MAEAFAAVTGVVSLIDVVFRATVAIYDSSQYLKDAPQLSQRLQRTVKSVQSVLRSLNEVVALHRQHQTTVGSASPASPTGPADFLCGVVKDELISINAELDILSKLLPPLVSTSDLRGKLRWVLDRKRVTEAIKGLDGHQITLILALQTFAHFTFNKGLSQDLGRISQQHESTARQLEEDLRQGNLRLHTDFNHLIRTSQALLPAQESIKSDLANLHGAVSTGHTLVIERLDAIGTSLSQIQLRDDCVRSSTVLTAPTEDVLARLFRAELRRVIMPTVQQCFDKFKASPDSHLDEIRQKIDEMAQQLGSGSIGKEQHDVKLSHDQSPSPHMPSNPGHVDQDTACLDTGDCAAATPFGAPNYHIQIQQKRSYFWTFRWRIGTLRVTFSTIATKRKISPDYRAGGLRSPRMAYRIAIEFVPTSSLIFLKGLSLSVASKQDQRGYYQLCPLISTFAVVPYDADIIKFIEKNNIEGIQSLFERGLAAPSDRTETGWTLLMYAVVTRNPDVCRLLLDEGSDPSAVDNQGLRSIDWVYMGSRFMDETNVGRVSVVVDLLKQADVDSMEPTNLTRNSLAMDIASQASNGNIDDSQNDGIPALYWAIEYSVRRNQRWPPDRIEGILQMFIDLGADINARHGRSPLLHGLFLERRRHSIQGEEDNLDVTLTAFLRSGADPHALADNGDSIFDVVESLANESEHFSYATKLTQCLAAAGYDPDQVKAKIDLAQRCLIDPGYGTAESTAVNHTTDKPPSTTGIVSRRVNPGDRLED
ncbi:MAG: hypothetical protein Q9168_004120 [Polycauliona sp. 1 TL-2023]